MKKTTHMINKNKLSTLLISAAACAMLAACQTTGTAPTGEPATRASKIDTALQNAAYSAAAHGERHQSLGYLEKIYKRNSLDPVAAANYGAALRDEGYIDRAATVLGAFADDPNAPAIIKTEYAGTQLALGNYEKAEKYAQKAVLQNDQDGKAYHYLGIALDAQGMHKEAERAFRLALDHWQGDPTSIMNNLALNLTSQGYLEEAIEIIRKAQAVSPHKIEIERNLRIVTALLESKGGRAPRPTPKPAAPDMDYSMNHDTKTHDSAPLETVHEEEKDDITTTTVTVPNN